MDDTSDIRQYYETVHGEQNRLTRCQLERDMRLRYFGEHLPHEGRILEIGAAAGAYRTSVP